MGYIVNARRKYAADFREFRKELLCPGFFGSVHYGEPSRRHSMGSDFLFAAPSFFEGMARVLDIRGTIEELSYNKSSTPEEADVQALRSDWSVVVDDLDNSLEEPKSFGE